MDLESLERLVRMPLRHNVRELSEILRVAIATSAGDVVVIEPGVGMEAAGDEAGADGGENPADAGAKAPVRRAPARAYAAEEVVAALEQTGGNKTAAAEALGMDRWALDRLMKKLGVGKD